MEAEESQPVELEVAPADNAADSTARIAGRAPVAKASTSFAAVAKGNLLMKHLAGAELKFVQSNARFTKFEGGTTIYEKEVCARAKTPRAIGRREGANRRAGPLALCVLS